MRVDQCRWQDIEDYLKTDDRCVVPLGCTEQHAYLSLATDSILAFKVAVDAAEPLGVPVFPVQPYGVTPTFLAYPGTVSISLATYGALLVDVLESLYGQGFRRFLFVNGHGGNSPASAFVNEWAADQEPGVHARWHDWWNAPAVQAKVHEHGPDGTHANWMEDFPWTRLAGVTPPAEPKPMVDYLALRGRSAVEVREGLGDGSFGGVYRRSDEAMSEIWQVAVAETSTHIQTL